MKRVQMILEDWQHEWLGEEAQRQSISMSALLRELLTGAIERRRAEGWAEDPIWGIVGMGAGPRDGVTSENLDEFLYRVDWQGPALAMVADRDASNSR